MHLGCLCALGIEVDMAFIQNVLLSRSAATANDMVILAATSILVNDMPNFYHSFGWSEAKQTRNNEVPSIGFRRLVLQSEKPPTEVIVYLPTLQFFQYSFNKKLKGNRSRKR